MGQNLKILVADESQEIIDILEFIFHKEGYEVKGCTSGKELVKIAKAFLPDLIIAEVKLIEMDGLRACKMIREVPELESCVFIFLTSLDDQQSELSAFEAGANDYVIKPIKPRLLVCRVNAFLKRNKNISAIISEEDNNKITINDLTIDIDNFVVLKKNKTIILSKKEFELLCCLSKNPNRTFRRKELIEQIWGPEVSEISKTLEVHISRIREKIGGDYIDTVKKIGYKFHLE
ncbi:PhoP family transcriptional regulator [Sporocytophaga myxococcoides]|uniref:PhoP family transcriptional regulator n=1 Tax=Sporocytophaga myxococcoides TaxID=153721 RepID=A0A098L8C9_9BACT|nr:response regulator transcription factor [Sporocytophaga myxococcoides]GAL82955.1 PhoP family transcriptional regulator [Sporocytophaga myxococcoides]